MSEKNNLPYVVSINISSGGIPKLPVEQVKVTISGLTGDGHNHAKHNTLLQAVCLQDKEKLEDLSIKGYGLFPGAGGENLTVKNLHVNNLPLGTILQFSGGVVLEISKVRKPCYVMDAIHPHLKEDALGRHGMYARVIKDGLLRKGEMIEVVRTSCAEVIDNASSLYPHTGAILCGGKSKRMGRPKAGILLPSGQTMVEHVYHTLASVCQRVVLVGRAEGIPESLRFIKRIDDTHENLGPLGGLEALLSSGIDTEYLISPCDLPKVARRIFALLASESGALPIVLKSKNGFEPLIGRYPSTLLPLIRQQILKKKFSMHELLCETAGTTISLPENLEAALSNANTPADLTL